MIFKIISSSGNSHALCVPKGTARIQLRCRAATATVLNRMHVQPCSRAAVQPGCRGYSPTGILIPMKMGKC